MASYPVELSDTEGIVNAVNYLMSGPAGLGQNFQGFSAYLPAYIRPSRLKQPWSLPIDTTLNPSLYLDIPVSDIYPCDTTGAPVGSTSAYIKLTFTTAQATAPFQFGDQLDIANVIDTGGANPPYSYDDIGYTVFSCDTTSVIMTFDNTVYEWGTYISGGNIIRDRVAVTLDTDCNARVTVEGPTAQVFVSAQINLTWEYTVNTPGDYSVLVSIERSKGFLDPTPGSPEYLFANTVTVSEKEFVFTATTSGTQSLEAIFTTVLDTPSFGYYWYILTVFFQPPQSSPPYDIDIGPVTTGLRSLTAQVIKQ